MSNQPPITISSQASDSIPQPASLRPWMKTCPFVEVLARRGFSCCSLPSIISFHTFIIRPKFQARVYARWSWQHHDAAQHLERDGVRLPTGERKGKTGQLRGEGKLIRHVRIAQATDLDAGDS